MKIDRKKVENAFMAYVSRYDRKQEKIRLKEEHTFRVGKLCEQLAASLKLSQKEIDLAWLIGMLHDVGRFEQLRRFGTFADAQSIDHARFGAQILFEEGKIRDYIDEDTEDALIQNAVAWHSAYRLPDSFDDRTRLFADLLRDADKIDILKVNVDFPLEEIYNVTTQELKHAVVSPEVLKAYGEHHAVLRSLKKTPADNVAGHLALVYELVYPESIREVLRQGYLNQLLDFQSEEPETRKQFVWLREEMEAYLAEKTGMRFDDRDKLQVSRDHS